MARMPRIHTLGERAKPAFVPATKFPQGMAETVAAEAVAKAKLVNPASVNLSGGATKDVLGGLPDGVSPQQYFDAVRASAGAGANIPSLQAAVNAAQAHYGQVAAANPLSGSTAQVEANMEAKRALDSAQSLLLAAQQNQGVANAGGAVGSTEGALLNSRGFQDVNQK